MLKIAKNTSAVRSLHTGGCTIQPKEITGYIREMPILANPLGPKGWFTSAIFTDF